MRDYPPPSNYANMLSSAQGIRLAFRDSGLQAASVEVDKLGMPRARSGAFAVVYRLNMAGGNSKAVRLFLKEEDDRQDRYKRIFEHLSRLSLPCLVPFAYEDNAFRAADGKKYPMMTMDWVVGETLYDWLHGRALAGDERALKSIAEKWRQTMKSLRDAKIAHGDLQHANVMVTRGGEIKLVDYDGMCVPSLEGRRNLEIGVDPYQHPGRNGDTRLSLGIDNFSAIFIYVAMRALAADPRLWNDFVVAKQYDKMMLTRQDLEQPGASPLIQRMKRSGDPEVQRLTSALLDLFRARLEQVPCLEDLFVAFDYRQVATALDQKDFDAAVGLLTRNGKQVGQAPPELQPRLQDAQRRVIKLTELLAAISSGDEEKTLSLATSPLLQGYPGAARGLSVAKDAAAALTVLKKLDAARHGRRWREFVREWDAAQPLLTRPAGTLRRSAEPYREEVHLWRLRNELCDKILAMLKSPRPDKDELERLWLQLSGYGGHPECDARKAAIQGAINAARSAVSGAATPPVRPGSVGNPAPGSALPSLPKTPSSIGTPSRVPLGGWMPVAAAASTGHATSPLAASPAGGSRPAASATRIGSPPAVSAALPPPPPQPTAPGLAAAGLQAGGNGHAVQGSAVLAAGPSRDASSAFDLGQSPDAPSWWTRFDAEVCWTLLVCGWRGALGGFIGVVVGLGAAMTMAHLAQPGVAFARANLLLVSLATGIVLGFLHGRDAIIGRPTFLLSRWWLIVAAAVTTATAAVIALFAFGAIRGHGGGLPFDVKTFGGGVAWALLSLGIVTMIGRTVPNVTLGPVAFSGLLAAGISWATVNAWQQESTGMLVGAIVLGLATSVLVNLSEVVSRTWYLEYSGGQGRLARLNLGAVPVLVGTDAASCHVVRPGSGMPVSLKYWVDAGQIFLVDCVGPQTYRVSVGDRRNLAGLVLTVKTIAAERTGSAPSMVLPSPVAAPPAPGVTQQVLTRPAVFGSPSAAAPVASTPRPSKPPPLPPPRPRN